MDQDRQGGIAARMEAARRARRADGMFPVPRAATPLPFTGERLTGAAGGQVEIEHLHRYCLARDLCAGLEVLDVASGEGYGAALLAGVARRVIGVEIDTASVAHAARAYARDNLRFLAGDATRLPLADGCVDAVVSFETLEHLPDQERFLAEVRRVLRPGGLFLVSTPDRAVYSAPGQPANPHHVLELTEAEFRALLGRHFARHALLAQRALLGSVLAPLEGGEGWRSYDRRGAELLEAQPGLSRAVYLLAAASDGPLPPLGASVFIAPVPVDEAVRAPETASALLTARAELSAAQQRLRQLETEIDRLRQLETEALALREAVARLSDTPLRRLARRMPWMARQARRARNILVWGWRGELPMRVKLWWSVRRRAMAPARPGDLRAALGLPPPLPTPRAEDLRLPAPAETPGVSILIPTYGQVDHTLRCLASLAAAPPATPFEVIVVDDASPDPRAAELARVAHIRLIRNAHNLGFLRSCNAAARAARGERLLLLNNDTEVMPGAVDALVGLLDARPDAGMVGARLL